MARVRSRDTGPERTVRRALTDLGYRYRLQYSKVPGRPDIAFPGRKKAIWVHGCFWHRHQDCKLARLPKTRRHFWVAKLEGNRIRDQANEYRVRELDWESLTIWECELHDDEALCAKLRSFLEDTNAVD